MSSDALQYSKLASKCARDIRRVQSETVIGDDCAADIHALILGTICEAVEWAGEQAMHVKGEAIEDGGE